MLPLLATLALAGPPNPEPKGTYSQLHDRGRDCAFGLLAWCLVDAKLGGPFREPPTHTPNLRLEAVGAGKLTNTYYRPEIESCEEEGCSLDFTGLSAAFDASVRLGGNPYSDDYTDLGLHVGTMPIVSIDDNAGFDASTGAVGPGDGALAYTTVRLTLRRAHFLYLIRSKYMVSSFGIGAAIPRAEGSGASFTGADGPKLHIGGKLGAQLPLTPGVAVGLVDHWMVVWWGNRFSESTFNAAYGLQLSVMR